MYIDFGLFNKNSLILNFIIIWLITVNGINLDRFIIMKFVW